MICYQDFPPRPHRSRPPEPVAEPRVFEDGCEQHGRLREQFRKELDLDGRPGGGSGFSEISLAVEGDVYEQTSVSYLRAAGKT